MSSLINTILSISFLAVVIRFSTPILCASLSSFSAASTGIGNIAVESIMTLSALGGILGSYFLHNVWLGLLVGLVVGILMALLIAFFSMKLGANPFLVGIALNTFADSLSIFLLYVFTGNKGTSVALGTYDLGVVDIPVIKSIPVLGELLSGQFATTYLCWICIVLFAILIYKTPLGMRMRACGLNPDAAKTAGINVHKMQVLSLILSGMFAALGGCNLSLNYVNLFQKQMVGGLGWMGIAANGIASGNYGMLLISSIIFGFFRAVAIRFASSTVISTYLVGTIPYFVVLIVLIVVAVINTRKAKNGLKEAESAGSSAE